MEAPAPSHAPPQLNGSSNGVNGANGVHTKLVRDTETSAPLSTVLRPNDLDVVPQLADSIKKLSGQVATNEAGSDGGRRELLEQARHLVQALETPRETMIKHCWAQPSAHMAITFGVNVGLFRTMLANGERGYTAEELGPLLGVQTSLLARLMRHLVAMGYLSDAAEGRYQLTAFSKALTIPIIADGYPTIAGGCHTAIYRFPEYAAKTGYVEPMSAEQGPFQFALDTSLNFFAWLQANNPLGMQFNHHMGGYSRGRPTWMDRFPTQERLIAGAKTGADDVLLVDIGGSVGHDLEAFHTRHPSAPGRLILQDLPAVLDHIHTLPAAIERQPYDFLTSQPVRGARAYYMHSVLHDWPDDTSAQILANVKDAMQPGYSKLLINENVIPDRGAHWEATALDLMMLTLLSSRERTTEQWRCLIEEMAGLRIVKVWQSEGGEGVESLIECELP